MMKFKEFLREGLMGAVEPLIGEAGKKKKKKIRENWYDEQDRDGVWAGKKKKKKKTEGGTGGGPDVPMNYMRFTNYGGRDTGQNI